MPSDTDPKTGRLLGPLLVVAVAPSLGSLAGLWIWPGPIGSVVYAVCKLLLYGIPAWVAWRTIDRTVFRAGIRRGTRPKAVLFGLGSGLLIGGLLLATWFLVLRESASTDRLVETMKDSGLDRPARFWLFTAWLTVGNSVLEEFVFRWFVDSRFRLLRVPALLAIPVSAAIFTIHHVIVLAAFFDPGLVVLGSCGVFLGGVIWSATLRLFGSIVPAWISHAVVDLAIVVIGASILGFL